MSAVFVLVFSTEASHAFNQFMNNNMWNVQYKRHNVSQLWSVLGDYDNKESALIHATRALGYYFLVKVTDPEGSVIWSN